MHGGADSVALTTSRTCHTPACRPEDIGIEGRLFDGIGTPMLPEPELPRRGPELPMLASMDLLRWG